MNNCLKSNLTELNDNSFIDFTKISAVRIDTVEKEIIICIDGITLILSESSGDDYDDFLREFDLFLIENETH